MGRDTAQLDAQQVRIAVCETMAENLSDGVVAPLFFYALGGVPAMLAYKMVNTLDSMIGHHDARYEWFGKTAARFDDAANYLPARLASGVDGAGGRQQARVAFPLEMWPGHASRTPAIRRRRWRGFWTRGSADRTPTMGNSWRNPGSAKTPAPSARPRSRGWSGSTTAVCALTVASVLALHGAVASGTLPLIFGMIPVSPGTQPPLAALSEPEQRAITRLCIETGLTLMQHGAESALVETVTRRLGLALGVERVEIALMSNALVVTTLSERHCITTVRRNEDLSINMHMVTETQRAMLEVEAGHARSGGVPGATRGARRCATRAGW